MKLDNVELLNFANSFADISGSILRKSFLKILKLRKNDGTLVTEIDIKIESKFRNFLKKKFPDHGVVGEEFGTYQKNNEYVWVIDPLRRNAQFYKW